MSTGSNPTSPAAPPQPNLLERLFTGAKADVAAVGGAISGGVAKLESSSLFNELAPKLKADFESVLPAALASGEQSVADFLTSKAPAAWEEIATGAGPIVTAFVQGVLARVAIGTAATASAAAT